MGKQTFKYILLCMGFYLVLAALQIFAVKPIINYFFDPGFWNYMIIYNVLLLLVNPIIVYLIIKRFFNFKCEETIEEVKPEVKQRRMSRH